MQGELPKPKEEETENSENGATNRDKPGVSSRNGEDDATVINDDDG